MLAEENQFSNKNSSNIIHQMQLFDLDRPKDITTFIEVCQEDYVVKEKTLNVMNNKKSNISKKKRTLKKNTKRRIKTTPPTEHTQHQRDDVCSQSGNRNLVNGNCLQNLEPIKNSDREYIPNITVYNKQRYNVLSKNKEAFSDQLTLLRSTHTTNILESLQQPQIIDGQNISLQIPNRRNLTIPTGATQNTLNSNSDNNLINSSHAKYSWNVIVCNIINLIANRSVENGNSFQQVENERFYVENKMRMFQYCYKHVVMNLLPHENNWTFRNKFIWKIISVAKSKSIIIQYQDVNQLLFEMLQWCKRRRIIQNNTRRQWPPSYYPPIHTPHMQSPGCYSQNQSTQRINHDSDKVGQTTCLFSLGSPGRELNISMDSNLYKTFLKDEQHQGINIVSKQIPKNQNLHERETPKLYETAVNPIVYSCQNPSSDGFIEIEIPMNDDRIQIHNENGNLCNSSCYIDSRIPNNIPIPITNHNVFEEIEIPIENKSPNNYIYNRNIAPHDNSVDLIANNNNLHQPVQNMDNQAEVSRSRSRDSGFMSPLNFNEQTSPVLPNEEVTPIITHVTSLNNNATYINKGRCNVCTRETNQRCIGCYKIYYCSRECQQAQWHLHKFLCF